MVLIDDDAEIRHAYATLIELDGYACEPHASARAFLATLAENRPRFPGPCCVISDVSMPEMDGLELQRELARYRDAPLILVSGSSGAAEAATGFRAGALDFLVKPIDAEVLRATVARALVVSAERRRERTWRAALTARVATLTSREREVVRQVAQGQTNPRIAQKLGISERTVKLYRQRGMEKLGAATLVDFVRLVDAVDF